MEDFVLTNNYVWTKARKLHNDAGISNKLMLVNSAWTKVYQSEPGKPYTIVFSFDSQEVNSEFRQNYNLLEKKKIDFFLSQFIDSYIYVYKLK